METHLAAEAAWAALVAELLLAPGVSQGRVVRCSALRYQRTYFALRHAQGLGVKLPAEAVGALTGERPAPFTPGGRVLPAWALVPDDRHPVWHDVGREALDAVRRTAPPLAVG